VLCVPERFWLIVTVEWDDDEIDETDSAERYGQACESAFKFGPSASTSVGLKFHRDQGISGKSIGLQA
jgi:hypothetical protein